MYVFSNIPSQTTLVCTVKVTEIGKVEYNSVSFFYVLDKQKDQSCIENHEEEVNDYLEIY